MSRCPKWRYADRIAAQLALTRIDRTNAPKTEQRAYRCSRCRGWHLTSQPSNGGEAGH